MASVEIVTIGTEILLGHLVDTNSVYIARMLADHGVDVYAKHSVGDNTERLAVMLADALDRADGVITTGGLGPTVDDLTKDAVATAVHDVLQPHETIAARARRTLSQLESADERQQPASSDPAVARARAAERQRDRTGLHRLTARR
jgi:nicotinamide-nucleotide amidase